MKVLRVIIILLSVVALCVALVTFVPQLIWTAFLRDRFFTPPPPSALNPPIYPNARQVKVEDKGNGLKITTFETTDKDEAVLAFYDSVLLKDRWVHPLEGDSYPDNVFEWHQSGPDGPTDLAYRLALNFTPTDAGDTEVQLDVRQFDPIH